MANVDQSQQIIHVYNTISLMSIGSNEKNIKLYESSKKRFQ